MSGDRAISALEQAMRRPLALAFAVFVISMGVFLVGLLLIVDATTSKVSYPSSVALSLPSQSSSPVPVSFPVTMVGKTSRATLQGRGGQAGSQIPTDGEAGQVSVRVRTAPAPRPKRPTAIGGVSGRAVGDAGLAGGTQTRGPALVTKPQRTTP